jgi:phage-related minor tail protein
MTKSLRALLVGAALTGFVAGTTGAAFGQNTGGDKAADSGKKATKSKKDKPACKGQNSCKGKGGCGATKGKNDCKGKGECRTDGKPMDSDKK